jgi:hypothetical protein
MTTTWTLVAAYDVRPVDFASGKRVALPAEELPQCHRCNRRHAKVYVVTNGAETRTVGSGCCKVAFDGWEPTKEELRRAAADERKRQESRRERTIDAYAATLRAAIAAVVVPGPVRVGEKEYGTGWGADGVVVWSFEGLTEERRACFRRTYVARATAAIREAFPRTLRSEIECRAAT